MLGIPADIESIFVPDARTRELRFDIGLLSDRLIRMIDWLLVQPQTAVLPIGLFGASTGAAAALVAAAERPEVVHAVVSRGGRPDLAGPAVLEVRAPTPGATGLLLDQPAALKGALDTVADEAGEWLTTHLSAAMAR